MTARRKPRSSLLSAALAAIAVLCLPATVRAQHYARFQDARDAYLRGEYAHVVDVLEPLIGGEVPEIRDEILLRESRKYLGAAYVLTGQNTLGRQQFEALLRAEGEAFDEYELDAAAFPSQVHAAFGAVRDRLIRQRREEEDQLQQRREADEQRRHAALLELVEMAQNEEIEVQHDPLLAWVPFGAGQFQNGDEGLGGFFALSEGATLLLGAAAFTLWYNGELDRRPMASTPVFSDAFVDAMYYTTQLSALTFGVLAIVGIIEAHANYVRSHTVRRRREVPDAILQDLDLAIGPGSVTLRLRF